MPVINFGSWNEGRAFRSLSFSSKLELESDLQTGTGQYVPALHHRPPSCTSFNQSINQSDSPFVFALSLLVCKYLNQGADIRSVYSPRILHYIRWGPDPDFIRGLLLFTCFSFLFLFFYYRNVLGSLGTLQIQIQTVTLIYMLI